MSSLRQGNIRSDEVLESAKGSPCQACFPGICNGDWSTTVWCHLNGHAFGKGAMIKSHDILGFHGCYACHVYYDVGHGTKPIMSDFELLQSVFAAVCMTWVELIRREIVKVKQNRTKPMLDRPVKPRKERGARAKVPNNPDRKIPSRPMRGKP